MDTWQAYARGWSLLHHCYRDTRQSGWNLGAALAPAKANFRSSFGMKSQIRGIKAQGFTYCNMCKYMKLK
jgi:hypothetical protein